MFRFIRVIGQAYNADTYTPHRSLNSSLADTRFFLSFTFGVFSNRTHLCVVSGWYDVVGTGIAHQSENHSINDTSRSQATRLGSIQIVGNKHNLNLKTLPVAEFFFIFVFLLLLLLLVFALQLYPNRELVTMSLTDKGYCLQSMVRSFIIVAEPHYAI